MNIMQDIIPIGQGVRTGKKLTECFGLVVHWIGVGQSKASAIRSNFGRDSLGTHYISDWNTGDIIQCVPEDEVTYHVGSSYGYTKMKENLVGRNNPNWYFVGIECCIGDKSIPSDWNAPGKHMELGKPSDKQYKALVEFAADFLTRNGMTVDNLYRHYDITGKLCHVWLVKDENRWEKFKADVQAEMEGTTMTREEIQALVDEGIQKRISEYEDLIAQGYAKTASQWAAKSWEKSTAKGVFDGTRPTEPMTREQAAVVLDRLGLLE